MTPRRAARSDWASGRSEAARGAREWALHRHERAAVVSAAGRWRWPGGDKRLPKREVQVHRPAGGRARDRRGPAGQRPRIAQQAGGRLRHGGLVKPLRVAAVERALVDSLGCAHIAKLRGAVGGEDQQRNAAVPRLDDSGREVDRGRAGGAEDGDGRSLRLGHPQREEAARTLVEMHPGTHIRMALQLDRERRRARAGAETDIADAGARQFIDERAHEAMEDVALGRGFGLACHGRQPPSARNSGRSFRRDSSNSRAGSEPPTMPHPA